MYLKNIQICGFHIFLMDLDINVQA